MEFSSLIVKKFAKLFARNERLRNKKSSEQLYIKQIQNFEFQTGRGSRTRTHINGFGDRYLSLWTIPLSAR